MRLSDYAYTIKTNEDRNAGQEELIKTHMRMVYSKARRYLGSYLYDDIVSAGLEQLCICAKKFDPAEETSFAGYAGSQIDYAMMKEFQRSKYSFNPSNIGKDLRKAFYAYPKYFGEDVRSENARSSMSTDLGIPLTTVDEIVTIVQHRYESIGEDQDFVSESETPEELLERCQSEQMMDDMIATAVESLSDRERQIIMSRKLSEAPVELRVLGGELGVSHQRVAQIETGAMKKMLMAIDKKFKKESYVDLFE